MRGGGASPDDRPALLRAAVAHAVQRHPRLLPDVGAAARVPGGRPLHDVRRRVPGHAADRRDGADGPEARLPRHDPQGHAVPADAAAAQRLLPVAPALGRDRRGARRRLRVNPLIVPAMLLGVDVGGTFTDAVVAVAGRLVTAKAPSTPHDQSEGVLAAVRAALERAGAPADAVEAFAHGTTVATNALLEGRGARTVLVATEGFEDVVELGRQARADLYRLCVAHPRPLVPPERRVGAPERMGPDGPVRALEDPDALAERIAALDPEAIAVCLLHAYRHPAHEQALGAALRERLPGVHVSLSHAVVGTFREYERAATTELDAALSPLLAAYLRALARRAVEAGLPEPDVMQSSGGLASLEQARSHAALTVLSGPAAGAAGAAWAALASGERGALCFDMGGTSCDVCVVEDGAARETAGRLVGGRPVGLPMLDLHTVGAGGGSIAWRDAGGALRVGPQSAGARPGPAAYGHGGTEPTVTDANLVLGRLGTAAPLAGGIALDADAARAAVGRLADALGLG